MPCGLWLLMPAAVCRYSRICTSHRQPVQAAAADAQPVAQGAAPAPHQPCALSRRSPATGYALSVARQHTPCSEAAARHQSVPACAPGIPAATALHGLPITRTAQHRRCAHLTPVEASLPGGPADHLVLLTSGRVCRRRRRLLQRAGGGHAFVAQPHSGEGTGHRPGGGGGQGRAAALGLALARAVRSLQHPQRARRSALPGTKPCRTHWCHHWA